MKLTLMLLTSLLIGSCAIQKTVISEVMLPDGVTWKINVSIFNGYQKLNDYCIKNFKTSNEIGKCIDELAEITHDKEIRDQAFELCGKVAYRVFSCGVTRQSKNIDGSHMTCYAQCTDKYNTKQSEISISSETKAKGKTPNLKK
jgi:hypothetical protein